MRNSDGSGRVYSKRAQENEIVGAADGWAGGGAPIRGSAGPQLSLFGGGGSAEAFLSGLSQSHKWTGVEGAAPVDRDLVGQFRITSYVGGELVKVNQVGRPRPRGGGGARGVITGFSRWSRRNMINLVHSIDQSRVSETIFLTMTAPAGVLNWQNIEKFRRLWFKKLIRRWGKTGWFAVWKKELHKNGSTHLHVLMFCLSKVADLSEMRQWNDEAWASTVATDEEMKLKMMRVACRVELMRSWNGVNSYCAKYLAETKDQDFQALTGRIWGVENRSALPVDERVEVVELEVGVRIRRALRKHQEKKREKYYTFSEGQWVRCYGGFDVVSRKYYTPLERFEFLKGCGFKVKRKRCKVLFNGEMKIWQESEILGKRGKKQIEPATDEYGNQLVEKTAYAPSRYFVSASDVDRLRKFFLSRWAYDQEFEAALPF